MFVPGKINIKGHAAKLRQPRPGTTSDFSARLSVRANENRISISEP